MQSFVGPDQREKLNFHDLTVFSSTCSLNIRQLSYLLVNLIQLYFTYPVSLHVSVRDFCHHQAEFYAKFVETCSIDGRAI